MKHLGIAARVFFVLSFLACSNVALAWSSPSLNLRGTYTGHSTGTSNVLSNGSNIEFLVDQILSTTFDGKGHFTGTTTQVARIPFSSFAQFTCVFSVVGSYAIDSNGIGSVDYQFTPQSGSCTAGSATASVVVGAEGDRIDLVVTQITQPGLNSVLISSELFRQGN